MEKLAIGLMSGTSADGCSLALAAFTKKSYRILGFKTYPYPSSLSNKILGAADLKVPEISRLNFELGRRHARAVLDFLRKQRLRADRIRVVGSHGQTAYHGPYDSPPNTLQIGEPSIIAEETGIAVASDFRPRDMAAGGQGAPLLPYFDHYFFGRGPVRAMQNIGGIANVCIVGKRVRKPIAFDNGPGNCLMDLAIRRLTRGRLRFDKGGTLAGNGDIDHKLVKRWAAHPYFTKRPPKSTGREIFGEKFIADLFQSGKKKIEDVLATLNYFTAYTIAESYKRFILNRGSVSEVIVSGGGAYNKTLMHHLNALLSPIAVLSIENYGVPAQAKEPVAFAFFGLCALEGKTNHLPGATGARRACILGKITPGKHWKGVL